MLNTTPERRVVEHVDDRPVNIGDRHLGVVTPDGLGAEDFFGPQVLECEVEALPRLVGLADSLSRNDHDVLENLLGQVPMLRCGAASDVARRKQRRHENPSIIENAFRAECIDRRRNIGAGPDTAQPTLLAPSSKALGRLGARDSERLRHIGNVDDVTRPGEDLPKLGTATRQPRRVGIIHASFFAKNGNLYICNIQSGLGKSTPYTSYFAKVANFYIGTTQSGAGFELATFGS